MGTEAQQLELAICEKDRRVTVDNHLQFEELMQSKENKANSVMRMIRRTYAQLDEDRFLLLYQSLVCQHLEYANLVWAPNLKKKKHIKSIESPKIVEEHTHTANAFSHTGW
jgi:hypothetical protein